MVNILSLHPKATSRSLLSLLRFFLLIVSVRHCQTSECKKSTVTCLLPVIFELFHPGAHFLFLNNLITSVLTLLKNSYRSWFCSCADFFANSMRTGCTDTQVCSFCANLLLKSREIINCKIHFLINSYKLKHKYW